MQSLIKQNLRLDGRALLELREVKIEKEGLNSIHFEVGGTILTTKVIGPFDKPRSRNKLNILVEGTQKNEELSKVLVNIYDKFVILPENSSLDIFVDVKQEDGSLFVNIVNSITISLCCTGINMKELVFGMTVGLYGNNLIIDILENEESAGYLSYVFTEEICVYLKSQNKITELCFKKMLHLADEHKMNVYEIYADFLRNLK
ncbi:exosome complex exonuclease Rrp41 [Tubulinosema ratisbonensis]|uniref:Exosome complex exonuclease Rrp41 n=1 Tax=Tubulinosema ratisbonensis TaxID=291195 RepID=A0A437AI42_9MICR|nr:exosome complex exonuclease Rrp41 [Tubulinosema ratisbonensis]RVD91426.1 exosome complex exonuclease Rrp41 [Tubulinosema ratisbonensis]